MEATFSGWFLGPYKVSKIGYGLFSYALQPAKRTSASFMGAILKEYLVQNQELDKKDKDKKNLEAFGPLF